MVDILNIILKAFPFVYLTWGIGYFIYTRDKFTKRSGHYSQN